jgi:putative hydrolase of HD superfamily
MRLLVTAGPTREYLDPVRFLSNRSSGKMGYAVAARAAARGHDVTLITGPSALPEPPGARLVRVTTAEEMLRAVEAGLDGCDALVMAAAVADYRPCVRLGSKLKKDRERLTLELERTPDILGTIRERKGERLFVGFAAETERVEEEAKAKLVRKGLDLIVANDVTRPGAGFDVDTNVVTLLEAAGGVRPLPLMSKADVADRILDWLEAQRPGLRARAPAPPPERLAEPLSARLAQQVAFVRELDGLKSVLRQTLLLDGSRQENDAEHSWHLALFVLLLREHANEPELDASRTLQMVLIHDLVELEVGDTYCYDDAGQKGRPARERAAAERLFGRLPADQGSSLRALWEEFEARRSPEARFAAALDRLQPLLQNYCTGGRMWRVHGVDAGRVEERNAHIAEGSTRLWEFAHALIRDAVARGDLAPAPRRRATG